MVMKPNLDHKHENPVQNEYAQLAQEYDDHWSFYVATTAQQTLQRLELHPGERVLDIGCGTGVLLAAMGNRFPEVILAGIDPTQEMLDIARKRLSKKVHITRSWAEKLPFSDAQFEVIVSCNMFHYIREPLVALKEMKRVLRPGGSVTITDWSNDYMTCQVYDLFLRVFNKAHCKTYKKRECYQLLAASGFTGIKIDSYKINRFWGMMTATASKTKY